MMPRTLASTSELDLLADQRSAHEDREIVSFPHGLPGFEECRSFVVFAADAAPFQWLSSVEGPPASFLAVDPRSVLPNFRYVLSPLDLARLQAADDTPLLWLAIVLVDADGTVSANLRAPIVINPASMIGQQVMPQDCLYPLRHIIVPPTASD
jgi:flagellar assembly factor FliW